MERRCSGVGCSWRGNQSDVSQGLKYKLANAIQHFTNRRGISQGFFVSAKVRKSNF